MAALERRLAKRVVEGLPPPIPGVPIPAALARQMIEAARRGADEGARSGYRQERAEERSRELEASSERFRRAVIVACGIFSAGLSVGFCLGLFGWF